MKRASCRQWWALVLTLSASTATLCAQDADQQESSEVIGHIIRAAKLRQQAQFRSAYVEWTAREHVEPEALRPSTGEPPNAAVNMVRQHRLILEGAAWRIDTLGDQLSRPRGADRIGIWQRKVVRVRKDGRVTKFYQYLAFDEIGRGQTWKINTKRSVYVQSYDMTQLFLFVRPLETAYFAEMDEAFRIDAQDEYGKSNGLVTLACKGRPSLQLWLDPAHGYVPVRLKQDDRCLLECDYALFDGFGYAPTFWHSVQFSEQGDPIRILSATVKRWHNEPEEIAKLIDYKFPRNVQVVNLD